jgi:hypothetical protein
MGAEPVPLKGRTAGEGYLIGAFRVCPRCEGPIRMADQDETGNESSRHQVPAALPATPSDKAGRPEGLAFDVEPGADLTGVPAGEQAPDHPGAARIDRTVRESGEGVGLAVPGDQSSPDN